MKSLFKFGIGLIVITAGSYLFIPGNAHADEMLVESSLTTQRLPTQPANLQRLFSDLGISNPMMVNPCIELEENTSRWCTQHGIKSVLYSMESNNQSRGFLIEVLKHRSPCQSVAEYIGRICKLENFKKIIKHFSNKANPE